jgi:hypothetical protein
MGTSAYEVASVVEVGMGGCRLAVARRLKVGMGWVRRSRKPPREGEGEREKGKQRRSEEIRVQSGRRKGLHELTLFVLSLLEKH